MYSKMKQQTVYFFIGLPGSGKSTYIEKMNLLWVPKIISADKLKEEHADYDPNNVTKELHEWSVKEAENQFYKAIDENFGTIIFDSGGINDNYSKRIMQYAKNKNCNIVLTIIDTPLVVCLERVEKRNRKVPYQDMFQKSFKMKQCIVEQSKLADTVRYVNYYQNNSLFLDMDGVLAAFQVFPLKNKYAQNDLSVDYIDNDIFLHALPVQPIIEKVVFIANSISWNNVNIISVSPNSKCNEEKKQWLKLHLPKIPQDNIYFVGSVERKITTLNQIMNKKKLTRENVLYVDDLHSVLWEGVNLGINAIHPSMFLIM